MESPHAAAATPTTARNSGGAPALCEGGGGRGALRRLDRKVGQLKRQRARRHPD